MINNASFFKNMIAMKKVRHFVIMPSTKNTYALIVRIKQNNKDKNYVFIFSKKYSTVTICVNGKELQLKIVDAEIIYDELFNYFAKTYSRADFTGKIIKRIK